MEKYQIAKLLQVGIVSREEAQEGKRLGKIDLFELEVDSMQTLCQFQYKNDNTVQMEEMVLASSNMLQVCQTHEGESAGMVMLEI